MLSVESCCCGCSLRVGTLILLWIGLINFSLGIVNGLVESIHSDVQPSVVVAFLRILNDTIISAIHLMGIYGVEKKKPSFLIPYLGVLVFFMVMIIISMVALAIFGVETFDHLPNDLQDKQYYMDKFSISVVDIEILSFFILGLFYYFFVVVRNYYKELKRETNAIVYKC